MVNLPTTQDWQAQDAKSQRYQARRMEVYAAMAEAMDHQVGRLVAHLKANGQYDNTVFLFLSDNGAEGSDYDMAQAWLMTQYSQDLDRLGGPGAYSIQGPSWASASVSPLNGFKFFAGEGGIRVPFIASWKNHITAGQVIDAPVASIDATATALTVAGALAPEPSTKAETTLDGINLMPLLTGKTTQLPDRPLFWRVGKKNALRLGDWKLIRDGKEWQLYDLSHDISETQNLATQEPVRLQQMSALWDKWNAEQIEPLWR